MRIGLIVPGFSAGANDWCIPALRHLVQRLALGDDVHVFALRYPYRSGRYDLFGARVTALGGGQQGGWHTISLWQRVLTALVAEHRRRRFDVLHAFWANETGALTAVAGRLMRVPTVVSLAGGELVRFPDIAYGAQLARSERVKIGLALRLADHVTAGSQFMIQRAARWPRRRRDGRAHRVPLGVDVSLFRPCAPMGDPGPPRLIHVASLSPVKDQATLVLSMAVLRDRGVDALLEIIGDGPLRTGLGALAGRLGLGSLVLFRGEMRHDQLPAVYGRGAVFVLSSRHEAQGMAVLEAAACGLPVVGTQVGVVPELAPEAGKALSVGDHVGLADGVAELLNDRSRCSAMGQRARGRAEEEFGLERSVQRFRELYANGR